MIEHYQGQTGEVAKRPQQAHAFQKRWAEISWTRRCEHPQHAIEQPFDPHKGLAFTDKKIVGATPVGQQLLHQARCSQSSASNAASIGAKTASLAPSGLPGKCAALCKSLHRNGKNFAKLRERVAVENKLSAAIVGSGPTMKAGLERLVRNTAADEVMIVT
jgi:hypothetical protein